MDSQRNEPSNGSQQNAIMGTQSNATMMRTQSNVVNVTPMGSQQNANMGTQSNATLIGTESNAQNKPEEGPSNGNNIGPNPVLREVTQDYTATNNQDILKDVDEATCKTELTKYEEVIPSDAVRPSLNEISFDPQKKYTFILFDIETSSLEIDTEIIQLSAITGDEQHSFSEYILPENSISLSATTVHKIFVRFSEGQTNLYKAGKHVPAKSLQTCLSLFVQFLENIRSLESADHVVLVGHNASVFDTPRLLLNAGPNFASSLQEMGVLFADSLPVLKFLKGQPNVPLNCATNSLSALYKALFTTTFEAHDGMEDVKALRKILFTPPLQVSQETMVTQGKSTSPKEALEQALFLKRTRQASIRSYDGKLYFYGQKRQDSLSKGMMYKLADAGLSFDTVKAVYDKYGINGLYGVLALPPSVKSMRRKSARVTKNKRIIRTILRHFQQS